MKNFTIGDIERLTGIKPHTLRIWEQRYNLFKLDRQPNTHRLYTSNEMQKLLQIAYLYEQGFRISQISALSDTERQYFIRASIIQNGHYQPLVNKLIIASSEMDDDAFASILKYINLQLGVKVGIVEIIYPFLTQLGLLWLSGEMKPAQEHFASNHLRNFICLGIEELDSTVVEDETGLVLLMTPEHEYHELPLLFIQYMMKLNNVPVMMIGANVSKEVLEIYIRRHPVKIVHYHHVINFTEYNTQQYFESLCRQFPDQVIVGSGGIMKQIRNNNCSNGYIITSAENLVEYCSNPFAILSD